MMQSLGSLCVLLSIFFAGTVAIAQGQHEPTLAVLRSGARPLVVGGVSEYTPFNVVGPDGQLTGMDREIVRAAAKRLDIKQVEFKTMTFSNLGQSLLDGKIDLIANNYWPTPDRERLYAFTIPYYLRGGVGSLWIEGTGPFDTAASMAGKRIAVLKGSYPEIWAREHVPTAIILPVDGTLAALDDTLRTGQADVVVGFYTRQRGVSLKHENGAGYKNALSNRCAQHSPYGRTRRSCAMPSTAFSKRCGPTARSTRSNASILTRWRSSRPHPRNQPTTQSSAAECEDLVV
jgi:ABC-type amino acid transport substrate-binding protein